MSEELINHSPDLKRLRDEGYAVEVRENHILVHDIPYLDANRTVCIGTLVSPISNVVNGKVTPPKDHVMMFQGSFPHDAKGRPINAIMHSSSTRKISDSIVVDHSFSNKPQGGFKDNFEKFESYIRVIFSQAQAVDSSANPQTHRVFISPDSKSVFTYPDTNSSRNGTMAFHQNFTGQRIAIIGLGGTGSYILDLVAKTPVEAILLYDDDAFHPHNAFRAPGAASIEEVNASMKKVDYLAGMYSRMHKGISPNANRITSDNVAELKNCSFVFIATDAGEHKRVIMDFLLEHEIPFIDVGIDVEIRNSKINGSVRSTFGSIKHSEHLSKSISCSEPEENGAYTSNIQIAELNSINASIAVFQWKQFLGVYEQEKHFSQSVFSTDDKEIVNDFAA